MFGMFFRSPESSWQLPPAVQISHQRQPPSSERATPQRKATSIKSISPYVWASGSQKSYLKMILRPVASFSQSTRPFELLPNPFRPGFIFLQPRVSFSTLIFKRKPHFWLLWGVDPSNHQHTSIECLYLLPRGYGGLSLITDANL